MSSTGSRKNNRDTDFVWNFVTVQQKQENNEWKDAEPGFVGSNKDRCTCLFLREAVFGSGPPYSCVVWADKHAFMARSAANLSCCLQ